MFCFISVVIRNAQHIVPYTVYFKILYFKLLAGRGFKDILFYEKIKFIVATLLYPLV